MFYNIFIMKILDITLMFNSHDNAKEKQQYNALFYTYKLFR